MDSSLSDDLMSFNSSGLLQMCASLKALLQSFFVLFCFVLFCCVCIN